MSFMMQAGMIKIKSPGDPVTRASEIGKFEQVYFPTPFDQGTEVMVIPAVQTFNGADTPGLRITEVTHTGFKIRLNELVARGKPESDGGHTTEIIGYLAIAM